MRELDEDSITCQRCMVGVWLSAKENNTYTIKMTGQLNAGGTRNKGKAVEEHGGMSRLVPLTAVVLRFLSS